MSLLCARGWVAKGRDTDQCRIGTQVYQTVSFQCIVSNIWAILIINIRFNILVYKFINNFISNITFLIQNHSDNIQR